MRWDKLFGKGEFLWKEPHQDVLKISEVFKEKRVKKVLDLGCGGGRHVVFLSSLGFEVFGVDISKNALGFAKKWLEKENLKAELKIGSMLDIPYQSSLFDACICVNVIYHNTLENIKKTISEVERVLKNSGFFYANFQARDSDRFGKGREVEKNTFVMDEGVEEGIPHHFSDKKEVLQLMKNFKVLWLKKEEYFKEYKHSRWNFFGQKR